MSYCLIIYFGLLIPESVQKRFNNTEHDILLVAGAYLKYAPDRGGGGRRKNNENNEGGRKKSNNVNNDRQ